MIATSGNGPTLSPRELAKALGVSESSVKRWVDAGRVPARRTSGGHRRIELTSALKFLRDSGRKLANPGILGLAEGPEGLNSDGAALVDRVYQLLEGGETEELTRIVMMLLVARKTDPASLYDGPLREAMARIGDLWQGGSDGIYEEHRATQVLLQVLDQVDGLFEPTEDMPAAVGGAIDGDPSLLPVRMGATVLASEGIRPVSLGADTPAPVFLEAAETVDAKLVWVSASYVKDPVRQTTELRALFNALQERGVRCILGGREAHRLELTYGERFILGSNMADIVALAREVTGGKQ